MKHSIGVGLTWIAVFAAAVCLDGATGQGFLVGDAQAIVGRPGTPVSVAGVARRTTRRTIYATSVYVATLPPACTVVVIEGMTLHHCGGAYYQPYGNQYVVVNVQ